jgi:NTE family protein
MDTPRSGHVEHPLKSQYSETALVFQGGGALGAYQAGVYQALADGGVEPDWLSGISIGAINAAIIAGNEPEARLSKLREFWEQTTTSFTWPPFDFGDDARRLFEQISGLSSMVFGQAGFFTPRFPPAVLRPHGAEGALSVYDTSPLLATLEALVDFDRINDHKTRLSLGSVNVRSGNFVYFDSLDCQITAKHVMASGALPPGFPPIEIGGEFYWDGGLVSNTPLMNVLDTALKDDTLVFQVDLFDANGDLPGNLLEVEQRRKHITYSSRTRMDIDSFREKHKLRQAIVKLYEQLPAEVREGAQMRKLRALGDDHDVAIIHLIYRRAGYESQDSDYEFSRRSMSEHWKAGLEDGRRTLQHPRWKDKSTYGNGIQVFDKYRDKILTAARRVYRGRQVGAYTLISADF